ncbi:hypothetical protein N7510_010926 [Penicillium lagena]|uniref:uncharacterized protein n=1 Tax=Penicillium lagena TaxID=94218 RepID=UPI00253F6DE0|nr:uncharacterized protein N7510_010926 [Penicillium lagena]KAJ5601392.1 hypothetical protein N7510_010926 [Penicillium lagena]
MSDESLESSATARNKRSCRRCNERKVRCDRINPCGACVKAGNLCVFPQPKRKPRTLNRPPVGVLLTRLRELETEVHRLRSSKHNESNEDPQHQSSRSSTLSSDQSSRPPHVDPNPFRLVQGGLFGRSNHSWPQNTFRQQYLQSSQIEILWHVYQKNVAPLIAILHRATTAQLVQDVSKGLSIDPASEALLLSVCFAAVVSMDPIQCQQELKLEHRTAIRNYETAVDQALSRANLIKSEEVVTLQAAVLYLLCARVDGDTRIVWAESAVAIRLAQAQGIHRDGKSLGLSAFQTEIRRRLWWYICILDMLCSEDQAVEMQIRPGTFDTQFPVNLDGDELEPDMLELPAEKKGFTDITLCIITSIMINEVHLSPPPLNSGISLQDRKHRIESVGEILHERYLNHFNLDIPIHWVSATIARLHLSKAWVSVHSQISASDLHGSESEYKDSVFRTAVELLEFALFLQTNHVTTQWSWLCRSYKQKDVVAYMMSELSARPLGPETDRAWDVVTKMTSMWKQGPPGTDGVLEQHIIELIERIDLLREAKLESELQFR